MYRNSEDNGDDPRGRYSDPDRYCQYRVGFQYCIFDEVLRVSMFKIVRLVDYKGTGSIWIPGSLENLGTLFSRANIFNRGVRTERWKVSKRNPNWTGLFPCTRQLTLHLRASV